MFLTSLQDKVKRIQELRRSNAAQPVRNKKKYTRKIKHKNKIESWFVDIAPTRVAASGVSYGCDQNHPGILGYN